MKFKLHDIRKSKAWNQLREEGREEGDAQRLRKTVETLLAKHKALEEIAELLDIPIKQLKHALEGDSNGRT